MFESFFALRLVTEPYLRLILNHNFSVPGKLTPSPGYSWGAVPTIAAPFFFGVYRGRAAAAHQAHNLKVVGSIPTPGI